MVAYRAVSGRSPSPRSLLWLIAAAAALTVTCGLALGASGMVGGLWLASVCALLGVVVARTPISDAPSWVRRVGWLLGAGALAGGLLLGLSAVASDVYTLTRPNVAPGNLTLHRVVHTALDGVGFGGAAGLALGLGATLLAIPQGLWTRRRAPMAPIWPAWTGPPALALGVLGVAAACEGLLANDMVVSGCSSGCGTLSLTARSRALGVALALLLMLGARHLVRPEATARPVRRALGALALAAVAALPLGWSYTAFAAHMGDHRWTWLGAVIEELPAASLPGAQVEVAPDLLGRALVVRLRDGRTVRWRLSLGWYAVDQGDRLVEAVKRDAAQPVTPAPPPPP